MRQARPAVVLLLALAFAAARPARADGGLEYAVKANYLVRFAAFVDWPAQAYAGADAPHVICVVGRDPFGVVLDRAAVGQTAHGRRLAVRRPAAAAGLAGCQIVYLGLETPAGWADRADGMAGVLVVTDEAVSPRRGAVHFVVLNNRVRFHIDQGAAVRAGLEISSRLLNLAVSVEGRR